MKMSSHQIGTNSFPAVATLPRPLWQIREELEAHMKTRPGNMDIQALTDWGAKRDRLQMWIDYATSQLGEWVA